MQLIIGAASWISLEEISLGFGQYEHVSDASADALMVDRNVTSLRRNFAGYIQTGDESKMQRVQEILGVLDRDIARVTGEVTTPDRRHMAERLAGLVSGLRNQMNLAAEHLRLRNARQAELEPLGSQVHDLLYGATGGDPFATVDALMRTRLALAHMSAHASDENRKAVETALAAFESNASKLTIANHKEDEFKEAVHKFHAMALATDEVTMALHLLVDEGIENLGHEAGETASKLRTSQNDELAELRAEFDETVSFTLIAVGVGLLVALVLAIAAASAVSRSVMRPIQEMARAAAVAVEIGEIIGLASQGDFRSKVAVENRTGFVRVIGDHVNSLFASVVAALFSIRRAVSTMAGAATTASGAVTEVTAGAGEQAAALQQVRDALHLSAQAITQATDSAQQASSAAEGATQLVAGSADVIRRLVASIESLADNGHKVAHIASNISELAQRTNILATTTAIEAARAGGDGGVFGVIAAQVNALSDNCGIAAREITAFIEEATRETETGLATADEAREAFEQILTRVEQTDGMLRSICEAMVSQQASSTEISITVDNLFRISEQNVQAATEISKTLEQLRLLGDETAASIASFKIE